VTRHAGHVLISRIVDAGRNWETEILRSFIELFCSLSVIWYTFMLGGQKVLSSLLLGVASGVAVIFCGELLTQPLRWLEENVRRSWGDADGDCTSTALEKQRTGCSLTLLGLYGWGALRLIYQHTSDILLASIVSSTMFFSMMIVSKLITAYPPTKAAGEVLQDRFLRSPHNWRARPLRSAIELSTCVGITLCTYGLTAGQLLLSLQAGIFAGMLVCAVNEAVASRALRRAVVAAVGRLAYRAAPYAVGTLGAFGVCGASEQSLCSLTKAALLACALAGAVHELAGSSHLRDRLTEGIGLVAERALPYAIGTAAAFALCQPVP